MLTITKDVNGRIPEGDGESEIVSSSPNNAGPPIDAAHVPKKLWRHSSMEVCANLEAKNESKVLVLYTGKIIDFSLIFHCSQTVVYCQGCHLTFLIFFALQAELSA